MYYNVTTTPVPFGFAVTRADAPAGSAPLFDTRGHRLVFKEQYIELTTALPRNSSVYGYSERTPSQGFRLQRDGIPMASWTRDSAAADPDLNSYGSWPFYLEVREGSPSSSPSRLSRPRQGRQQAKAGRFAWLLLVACPAWAGPASPPPRDFSSGLVPFLPHTPLPCPLIESCV